MYILLGSCQLMHGRCGTGLQCVWLGFEPKFVTCVSAARGMSAEAQANAMHSAKGAKRRKDDGAMLKVVQEVRTIAEYGRFSATRSRRSVWTQACFHISGDPR